MSKLPLTLKSTAAVSKVDATPWSRELWRAAYAMARRMVRDRRTSTAASAWTWYLKAARARFGASGWRIAQAAGRVVFDARTATVATGGSVAELTRQGLVRSTRRPRLGNLVGVVPYRCAAFDRVRPLGLNMAFGYDPLASSANRGVRLARAVRLRQERATRREVARGLAVDRLALDGRDRFALTDLGRAALAASRVNPDAEVVL
jgi:hypothetical protein